MATANDGLAVLVRDSKDGAVLVVEDLERRFKILERWEIVAELKRLHADGQGRFVAGRRGQPSRFIVGENTFEEQEEYEEEAVVESRAVVETRQHTFVFRRNIGLSVSLPDDLTTSEAKRIIKWVETLPDEA